ncbi:MAG: hypothetical protein RL417_1672 [Pseudomonadota bacterium]
MAHKKGRTTTGAVWGLLKARESLLALVRSEGTLSGGGRVEISEAPGERQTPTVLLVGAMSPLSRDYFAAGGAVFLAPFSGAGNLGSTASFEGAAGTVHSWASNESSRSSNRERG